MLTGVVVDDLDGGADRDSGYRSLLSGPPPQVELFKTLEDERSCLEKTVPNLIAQHGAESIGIVARTNKAIDDYATVLRKLRTPYVTLDRDADEARGGVRLATMHRVKGLEFPCMILVGINAKVMPLITGTKATDSAMRAE